MTDRLLVEEEPHDGAWNMAFDEALLEAAAGRGEASIRVYRWSEPTISLGYFQKRLLEHVPVRFRDLPVVRRLSGGGAILHDREWTYSCCVPAGHRLARSPELLYDAVHHALIEAFAVLGIDASLRGRANRDADSEFLCFSRGDPRDVVVRGRKVVGSAQRRRRGAVLQHGSVLLRASPLAPEIPGLLDLAESSSDDPLLGVTDFLRIVGPAVFRGEPARQAAMEDVVAAAARVSEPALRTRDITIAQAQTDN